MDNVCHTLVGAALGEAGLKHRTRLGNATLMIAANLPDLDVLIFATSTPPIAFRRGWTHGVLAQALLPILLTAAIWLFARRRSGRRDPPLHPGWLLALAYIGVYSHVLLDLLNTYGIRLLTPLDWRWFYGDAVFIIDPWLWLTLGAGIWMARRRGSYAPVRRALAIATLYIGGMVLSGRLARDVVIDAWHAEYGRPPVRLMVGPRPITPFEREVVVDAGDYYQSGSFSWWPRRVSFDPRMLPKNADAPQVARARQAPEVRAFLVWSRFPYWVLEPTGDGTRITVADMRFRAFGDRFGASTLIQR